MKPSEAPIDCPFCSASDVKINGNGFYRCRGRCKKEFYISYDDEPLDI